MQHLVEVATGVFNSSDVILKQEKDWRAKFQGKIWAQVLAATIVESPQHQANQGLKKKPVSDQGSGKTPCYGYGQIGHQRKECPKKCFPPGLCPVYNKKGHWKRDCPHLQKEREDRNSLPCWRAGTRGPYDMVALRLVPPPLTSRAPGYPGYGR